MTYLSFSLPIRRWAVAILSAALLCIAQAAFAHGPLLRGPKMPVRAQAPAPTPDVGQYPVLEALVSAPILLYQHVLRPHWGHQCAYYPSCSNYALLAIRKHGVLVGSMMAFDRLQHEADEATTSPPIVSGGRIKVHDPLENNDFWWYIRAHPGPAGPMGGN